MMTNNSTTQGLYIYGIIPNYYGAEQFRKLDSIGVFNIPYQKVSAIVSKSNVIDYRQLSTEPLAKLLINHQKTIESLMNMDFGTIIPLRLGTFANNTSEVLRILENGYDLIMETLGKANNLLEIDIVSTWSDFGQVLAEVAVHPEVIEMKEKIIGGKTTITQNDQLSIGFLVKKILDERKTEYAAKIKEALEPFSQSAKQHELMNDQMISNTAFLVKQSQSALFEKALDQLDESVNGKLNFNLVGPLPCYSFYTMEVKELCYNELESAKKELGLSNSTSEKDIKQAYLDKAKLCHPDTNPGIDSNMIFNRINKAYQTMLDYVNAVKPLSREDQFSLLDEALVANLCFLKIKE
jgi:hypothetical protein